MNKADKKNIWIYSSSGLFLLSLIMFTGVKHNSRTVDEVTVEIQKAEFFFINQLDIKNIMTNKNADYIVGVEMGNLNLKALEEQIKENPFVKEAQVYRDLKGILRVVVEQNKPIARLFMDGEKDRYIDTAGRILPVNAKHTARVPLVEIDFKLSWENTMKETHYGTQIFELLDFIEKDKFWKAQIAHIFIKKSGDIDMYPQLTKQIIEFGKPENVAEKFSNLMVFYKKILPRKGWNFYNRVNLKFKNQIICE